LNLLLSGLESCNCCAKQLCTFHIAKIIHLCAACLNLHACCCCCCCRCRSFFRDLVPPCKSDNVGVATQQLQQQYARALQLSFCKVSDAPVAAVCSMCANGCIHTSFHMQLHQLVRAAGLAPIGNSTQALLVCWSLVRTEDKTPMLCADSLSDMVRVYLCIQVETHSTDNMICICCCTSQCIADGLICSTQPCAQVAAAGSSAAAHFSLLAEPSHV
jgi:hypothetical protein